MQMNLILYHHKKRNYFLKIFNNNMTVVETTDINENKD